MQLQALHAAAVALQLPARIFLRLPIPTAFIQRTPLRQHPASAWQPAQGLGKASAPATIMGCSAVARPSVLNSISSMAKCSSAMRKEPRVAPGRGRTAGGRLRRAGGSALQHVKHEDDNVGRSRNCSGGSGPKPGAQHPTIGCAA